MTQGTESALEKTEEKQTNTCDDVEPESTMDFPFISSLVIFLKFLHEVSRVGVNDLSPSRCPGFFRATESCHGKGCTFGSRSFAYSEGLSTRMMTNLWPRTLTEEDNSTAFVMAYEILLTVTSTFWRENEAYPHIYVGSE